MFDFVPTLWHRISQGRADRRRARMLNPSPSRMSFGERTAIGLGCDTWVPTSHRNTPR